MDKTNPDEVARAIAALGAGGKIPSCQWAVLPSGAEQAYVCLVVPEVKPNPVLKDRITARLMVFEGFQHFSYFAASHRIRDFGFARNDLEIEHIEVALQESGAAKIMKMRPGFVPRDVKDERERRLLAAVLYECYGFIMRLEEDPELFMRGVEEHMFFARWQDGSGKWSDGVYRLPKNGSSTYTERIALKKDDVEKALALPMDANESWEAEFIMFPAWQTREENPRFLYVLGAVDAATGERTVWSRMSVGDSVPGNPTGDASDALRYLWECHAQRILRAFLRRGRVPGEICVRSGRLMRFLRPLALKIPFKLTLKDKTPTLDALVKHLTETNTI